MNGLGHKAGDAIAARFDLRQGRRSAARDVPNRAAKIDPMLARR
jgi:hypothetical protein